MTASYLSLVTSLQDSQCGCFRTHFTDKKTEARGDGSPEVATLGVETEFIAKHPTLPAQSLEIPVYHTV